MLSAARRRLYDVHPCDKPLVELIHVDHVVLGEQVTLERAHDLANIDGETTIRARRDRSRLDARVYRRPLARPVSAEGVVSPYPSPFPCVRPVHILAGSGEHRIDVARVESDIERSEPLLGAHASNYTQLNGCE